jgi:hypothetical protein
MAVIEATDLMAAFLVAALALLLADALAALWLAGRLSGPIGRTTGAVLSPCWCLPAPGDALAQEAVGGDGLTPEDELALLATSEVTLAYVITGDPELDRTSQAGLQGLTNTLWARTSVEPAPPSASIWKPMSLPSSRCSTGPCRRSSRCHRPRPIVA